MMAFKNNNKMFTIIADANKNIFVCFFLNFITCYIPLPKVKEHLI